MVRGSDGKEKEVVEGEGREIKEVKRWRNRERHSKGKRYSLEERLKSEGNERNDRDSEERGRGGGN